MSTIAAYTHVKADPDRYPDTAADIYARGKFNAFYATAEDAARFAGSDRTVGLVRFDAPAGCEFVAISDQRRLLSRGHDLTTVLAESQGPVFHAQIFVAPRAPERGQTAVLTPLADFAISVQPITRTPESSAA